MRTSLTLTSLALLACMTAACAADTELDDPALDAEIESHEAQSPLTASVRALSIKSAVASTSDENVAKGAIDGKADTRWSGKGKGATLTVELSAPADVDTLVVSWYRASTRSTSFSVQVSENGTAFTEVVKKKSSKKGVAQESYAFAKTRARFVRVTGFGNGENEWNSINDLAIEGVLVGPQPQPEPEPEPEPAPSGIDLTNWKITLPVGQDEKPREVKQPELAGFELDPWFVRNADGSLRFRANAGGFTTSGSSYPRSELREMKSQGLESADWSTSSGTHTMTIAQKITATPAKKPHVVVGQIHDASDDVVMIRLEGSRLFVEGDGQDLGLLAEPYALGTPFTVKLEATGGHIRVYYNGGATPKVDVARAKTGCYFKAGMYTQSNTSKGDAASAYGEAVITSLVVTHSNAN